MNEYIESAVLHRKTDLILLFLELQKAKSDEDIAAFEYKANDFLTTALKEAFSLGKKEGIEEEAGNCARHCEAAKKEGMLAGIEMAETSIRDELPIDEVRAFTHLSKALTSLKDGLNKLTISNRKRDKYGKVI